MSLGRKLEGTAYAVLNELLSGYHGTGGFSRPSRYEVLIIPPRGSNNNPTSGDISNNKTIRESSLACESISFPGRNIDTTTDTNIYGPTREIASGFSYAEVSATFRCSSDMKEKLYFETWQKQSFNTQTWSIQYYEDYIGAVQIFKLDENNGKGYIIDNNIIKHFSLIFVNLKGYCATIALHIMSGLINPVPPAPEPALYILLSAAFK